MANKARLTDEEIQAYRQERKQVIGYFNRHDSRVVYRKHGGTGKYDLNYGNPWSYLILVAFFLLIWLLLVIGRMNR